MDDDLMPLVLEYARAGKTRAPMERIYKIHEKILAGELPNCSKLAKELEVTAKTIQRDITFMRDRLNLPLEYDEHVHGYRYTADVSQFPVFEFKAADLAGLFLARHALENVKGTKMEQAMSEVFAKLTSSIEGQISFSWEELISVPHHSLEDTALDCTLCKVVTHAIELLLVSQLVPEFDPIHMSFNMFICEPSLKSLLCSSHALPNICAGRASLHLFLFL